MEEIKLIDKCRAIYSAMVIKPVIEPAKISGIDQPRKIIDVFFASDGTVRTAIEGEKYPVRFFTPQEAVDVIASYKRLFSLLAKKGFWGGIILYFNQDIWKDYLNNIFNLYPVILKEERWSQPVKELRRILDIDITLKNAISLVFENDMAYRYRLQDILQELNQDNLSKNPRKELRRLFKLMIDREHDNCIKLWKVLYRLSWLLYFLKKPLMKLNIDEIKMSPEDIYWSNINESYDMRGLSKEQRIKEYNLQKNG